MADGDSPVVVGVYQVRYKISQGEDQAIANMAEFYENGMNHYASKACVRIPYINSPMREEDLKSRNILEQILDETPTKGQPFTSVHIVYPPTHLCNNRTERVLSHFREKAAHADRDVHFYALPEKTTDDQPIHEYEAVFEIASQILLDKASRSSLLIFVGTSLLSFDVYGALIGKLLPPAIRRGQQLYFITMDHDYVFLFGKLTLKILSLIRHVTLPWHEYSSDFSSCG